MLKSKQNTDHRRVCSLWSVAWGIGLLFLMLSGPALGQTAEEIEDLFWRSVECKSKRQVELYLETYPNGAYIADARACLEGQLGLERAERILVQRGLVALDYSAGVADGLFGPATRKAIRAWQAAKEFAVTGYLTRDQADALIAQGREVVAQADAERKRQEEEARRQAAEAERQRQAQETLKRPEGAREWVNSLGMEFVLIEPETFQMGSPATEPGRFDIEGPVHEVTISQPFYLGKYEVTQEQWQAVMGYSPSRFSGCGTTCPVESVSWEDVQGFIEELNARERVQSYRLPTEAEWEYAARGGTQTAYSFGVAASRLRLYGWYEDNSGGRTHPVGEKRPNTFGLYDMHGNVDEWVEDWYGAYPSGPVTDPHGPSTGDGRVNRGGSYTAPTRECRAALRYYALPAYRCDCTGFRLARTR